MDYEKRHRNTFKHLISRGFKYLPSSTFSMFSRPTSHLCEHGNASPAGVSGWTSSRSRCTHKASPLCGCVYGPSACRRLWNSSRRIRTRTDDRLKAQSCKTSSHNFDTDLLSWAAYRLERNIAWCVCSCIGQTVVRAFLNMHIMQGNVVNSDITNVMI